MSRYFYDNDENHRIAQVHADPAQASILRKDADAGSAAPAQLAHAASVAGGGVLAAAARARSARGADRSAVLHDSEAMSRVREAQEEQLTMALKHVFELYNRWEGGVNRSRMNKMRFHKVFRCAFPTLSRYCSAQAAAKISMRPEKSLQGRASSGTFRLQPSTIRVLIEL
jgi:hypothetical protein